VLLNRQLSPRLALAAAALGAAAIAPAHAQDTLVLTNGDRLSGDYQGVVDGQAVLVSPVLGTLRFDPGLISEAPDPGPGKPPAETDDAIATTAQVEQDAQAASQPQPQWWQFWRLHLRENWDGEIKLGFSARSGNTDTSDIAAETTLDWERPNDSFQWNGYYRYGETEDVRDDDEYGISQRYRRDLSERTFLQALTSAEVDQIKEIDLDARQNLGLGYRIYDRENLELNIVPGAGVRYLDQLGADDGASFNLNLAQEFFWQVTEPVSLRESFNFLVDPADTSLFSLTFLLTQRTDLNDHLALDLTYRLDFDNDVAADNEEADQRVIASLVYKF